MSFAALILLSLLKCNDAIAVSVDVGRVYSTVTVFHKTDATVDAEKKSVSIEMHRGWCGSSRCLVGRSYGGKVEFKEGKFLASPHVASSRKMKGGFKVVASFCDNSGACQDINLKDRWQKIETASESRSSYSYIDYLIIAPMKSKNEEIDIEFTTFVDIENETW